jgi:hypothetical protein
LMSLKSIFDPAVLRMVLPIVCMMAFITGCRGSFERPGEEETTGEEAPAKPEYDPMGLPADYDNVPDKYPLMAVRDSSSQPDAFPSSFGIAADSGAVPYESYRIQLFTSKTYGPAVRELDIAREVFDREVFLDYEVPYYKVRIGDFRNREAAEKYLPAAKEAGYRDAWVVRVATNVRQLESIYDKDIPPLIDSSDTNMYHPEPPYDILDDTED